MFRNILDRLKEAGAYLMQSRLVTLIIIFCVSSSILIGRLFYLQIVKGSDYLENYEYSIRRTTSVAATRGNIYDRNGNLLAYNQLAYSVTINLSTVENSITTDKRSEKNAALNKNPGSGSFYRRIKWRFCCFQALVSSWIPPNLSVYTVKRYPEAPFYCRCLWKKNNR